MKIKKILIVFILFIGVSSIIFPFTNVYSQESENCFNSDAIRELDYRFDTGVQDFDVLNKELTLTVDLHLDDDWGTEPFDAVLRVHPGSGPTLLHVEPDPQNGDYKATHRGNEHYIHPLPVVPSYFWPFESYSVPAFLEFDSDVRLCGGNFEGHKFGVFSENPDWKVTLYASDSSLEEMNESLGGKKAHFANYTIIKFDTVISHSDVYLLKHFLYAIAPLFPLALIFAHWKYVKSENLGIHITFFTGVSVLILTGVVAISSNFQTDLTILELFSFSSIVIYSMGFFRFLSQRHHKKLKEKTQLEKELDKRRIQALPKKLDED